MEGRLLIKDDKAAEAKLQGALFYIEKNRPDMKVLIDKRLKHIIFLGGPAFPGELVIHNFEGESVIGEYHVSYDFLTGMTDIDLAERICAAAVLVAAEETARPIGSWPLSGEEVELVVTHGAYLSMIGSPE